MRHVAAPRPASVTNWAHSYAEHVERAEVSHAAGHGTAAFHTHDLGPIRVAMLRGGPSTITRGQRDIVHGQERALTFVLVTDGRATLQHYGHHATLAAGDFSLCDSGAPHSLHLDEGAEVILLRVPAALAREHLPTPDHCCGRRLAADQGLASTAAAMATTLVRQLESGLAIDCREQAARHLLGILASAFVSAFDQLVSGSSIMAGRHWKVKLYINQHLRDPNLSPSLIAQQLKLSSRYLRMIFAAGNESPSAYILRRRLEECARRLADPCWRGHSITEIAFSWGFNSAPHFTRSFRERFHLSPRDYRQQKLGGGLPVPKRPLRQAELAAAA